jgi:hypothetical protein
VYCCRRLQKRDPLVIFLSERSDSGYEIIQIDVVMRLRRRELI